MEDQPATVQSESNEQHDLNELRIVLLGVTGAGKSPTANAILGREAFRESRTRESEIQRGRVEDRNISIIDTPGFFNTQLTDEEQQKQMMKSLDLSHPGPHVFLLLINLETFRDDQRNIVEQILQNFGEEALLFTMMLFVRREKISKRDFNQFIESEKTQKILNYFEGRFHVINSKSECDSYQITMLLAKIDEMVKKKGGQNYNNEIYLKKEIKTKSKDKMTEDKKIKQDDVSKESEGFVMQHSEVQEHLKTNKKSREGIEKTFARESLHLQLDLRIVVVGKTGSGKSSTGNTIIGKAVFKQDISSNSVTIHCQRHLTTVEGKTISVIDTPGQFDTSMNKEELKAEIEKCIYMSAPGPHVFLLVIKVGRITAEERNTVKWIQTNFGEEAACYTVVLFTHADALGKKSLDEYISESNDFKALVDECGGRFHSFNNKDMENRSQVTELLKKIEKMVKENGGQHYTNEMYRKAQKEIEWEAFKQKAKDYAKTALKIAAGAAGAVGVSAGGQAVTAAGGPAVAAEGRQVSTAGAGAGAGAVIGLVKSGFRL